MSIFTTSYSDSDIAQIQQLLENAEKVPVTCEREFSGIWFQSEDRETELRLLVLSTISVTVSRVSLRNKRQGTMEKIFEFLKDFCYRNHVSKIVIQSVLFPGMAKWCEKNGFTPEPTCILLNGFMSGDWQYFIKQ